MRAEGHIGLLQLSMSDTSASDRAFCKAAWLREYLQRSSSWIHPLTKAQQSGIVEFGTRLEAGGADVMQARQLARQEPGAAPRVRAWMEKLRNELQHGERVRAHARLSHSPLVRDGLAICPIRDGVGIAAVRQGHQKAS